MRLKNCFLVFAVAIMGVIVVRQTYAVWVEEQLTPKTAISDWISFTVKTKDVEGLTQFEVAVESKKRNISPVLTARLHLVDGKKQIASVPVEEIRADGRVTYWFRVAPTLFADSKFEFGEHGYTRSQDMRGNPATDEWGRPKYHGVPGGSGYWFYLRDFADPNDSSACVPSTR